MTIEKKELDKESDFNAWLESINFVGKDLKIIRPLLVEDGSDDPEGDRG